MSVMEYNPMDHLDKLVKRLHTGDADGVQRDLAALSDDALFEMDSVGTELYYPEVSRIIKTLRQRDQRTTDQMFAALDQRLDQRNAMSANKSSILSLPYPISERLRYSDDPHLGLDEYSTRRVRHLIPTLEHIGKKRLAIIDVWLEDCEEPS